jgi:heme/copper-type cytochrome/quinol oxidase subunit 2
MKSSTFLTIRKFTTLAFLFVACVASGESTNFLNSPTNIFAPASTPAKMVGHLSVFVLAITGIIFVVVFTLLAYSVIKFCARDWDANREPAQVYGSTQIELAWTIIPILIIVVLFSATARVLHAVQDALQPTGAVVGNCCFARPAAGGEQRVTAQDLASLPHVRHFAEGPARSPKMEPCFNAEQMARCLHTEMPECALRTEATMPEEMKAARLHIYGDQLPAQRRTQ